MYEVCEVCFGTAVRVIKIKFIFLYLVTVTSVTKSKSLNSFTIFVY